MNPTFHTSECHNFKIDVFTPNHTLAAPIPTTMPPPNPKKLIVFVVPSFLMHCIA